MSKGGWDLEDINDEIRLIFPGKNCSKTIDEINKNDSILQEWKSKTMSTTFWEFGRAELTFGNCNRRGKVTVLVNDKEIKEDRGSGLNTVAHFDYEEGTVLTIKADSEGIIQLFNLRLICSKFFSYNL